MRHCLFLQYDHLQMAHQNRLVTGNQMDKARARADSQLLLHAHGLAAVERPVALQLCHMHMAWLNPCAADVLGDAIRVCTRARY